MHDERNISEAAHVEIRRARRADAQEIARLAAELGYATTREEMDRRLAHLLSRPNHYIAVAAIAPHRLLGWMHVEHRRSLAGGEHAELMGLVVDATARRRGIGRTLLEAAEEWSAAKGATTLTVRSNAARELSHPFYEAHGFARTKTQHVYAKLSARRG